MSLHYLWNFFFGSKHCDLFFGFLVSDTAKLINICGVL